MEDKNKCVHATCTCTALPLQDYCCDSCKLAVESEQSGEEPMTEFHCGHPDCGGQSVVPVDTQSIFLASEILAVS